MISNFFKSELGSLSGLFLILGGIRGEFYFWGCINKDGPANVHITRNLAFLFISAALVWTGMALLAAHFSSTL